MKSEEGQVYMTRDGQKAGPAIYYREGARFPWEISIGGAGFTYTHSGRFMEDKEHPYDIIDTWRQEEPTAEDAAGHIADLLMRDDGQAHKEARKFLALHFPELIEKHNL